MASVLELILRTKKQGTGAKDTSKDLMGLEKLAKKVGIAFVAMTAAKAIKNAALLAARVETLGVVTKKLGENVGMTEHEIRSLEQSIVDQGITLQGSRQAIAMMIQSNVELAHATDLARLAQDTAVIANLNSSEAFQQLTYVLQTGNVRMARTLGLNVQFGKAQQALAKELGITTAELTEQQIMQARTNAVMDAGTRIAGTYEAAMETAGKKILSMDRQLEEMSRMIGEIFLPALEEGVGVVYETTKAFNESVIEQRAFKRSLDYLTNSSIDFNKVLTEQGIIITDDWGFTQEYIQAIIEMAEAQELATYHADELMLRLAGMGPVELEVEVNTTPARAELETFDEWLTRWSRENKRKLQLEAVLRVSEELATGGEGGGEFRQHGGPVQAGQPYIVGEREAELFVPTQAGHVYNQNQLAGGDVNINNGLSQRAFNNMAEDFFRGLSG